MAQKTVSFSFCIYNQRLMSLALANYVTREKTNAVHFIGVEKEKRDFVILCQTSKQSSSEE